MSSYSVRSTGVLCLAIHCSALFFEHYQRDVSTNAVVVARYDRRSLGLRVTTQTIRDFCRCVKRCTQKHMDAYNSRLCIEGNCLPWHSATSLAMPSCCVRVFGKGQWNVVFHMDLTQMISINVRSYKCHKFGNAKLLRDHLIPLGVDKCTES